MSVVPVELSIKRFKKQDFDPFVDEGIYWLVHCPVAFPESPQKFSVFSQPPFPLNKVEEHTAVEELQGIVMSPGFVSHLLGEILLEKVKDNPVFTEELFGDCLNIECLIVAFLNG